jgi:hypothetical protein
MNPEYNKPILGCCLVPLLLIIVGSTTTTAFAQMTATTTNTTTTEEEDTEIEEFEEPADGVINALREAGGTFSSVVITSHNTTQIIILEGPTTDRLVVEQQQPFKDEVSDIAFGWGYDLFIYQTIQNNTTLLIVLVEDIHHQRHTARWSNV